MTGGMFAGLQALFRLQDSGWEHHANPWSVWTRVPIMPLLTLALWSRVWIGMWCLVPIAALIVFTLLNPRLFPKVPPNDGWIWAAVHGERLWIAKDDRISHHRLHWAGVTTILQAPPVAIWATGLVFLWPWMTAVGLAGTLIAKFAFLDQMAKAYREATA